MEALPWATPNEPPEGTMPRLTLVADENCLYLPDSRYGGSTPPFHYEPGVGALTAGGARGAATVSLAQLMSRDHDVSPGLMHQLAKDAVQHAANHGGTCGVVVMDSAFGSDTSDVLRQTMFQQVFLELAAFLAAECQDFSQSCVRRGAMSWPIDVDRVACGDRRLVHEAGLHLEMSFSDPTSAAEKVFDTTAKASGSRSVNSASADRWGWNEAGFGDQATKRSERWKALKGPAPKDLLADASVVRMQCFSVLEHEDRTKALGMLDHVDQLFSVDPGHYATPLELAKGLQAKLCREWGMESIKSRERAVDTTSPMQLPHEDPKHGSALFPGTKSVILDSDRMATSCLKGVTELQSVLKNQASLGVEGSRVGAHHVCCFTVRLWGPDGGCSQLRIMLIGVSGCFPPPENKETNSRHMASLGVAEAVEVALQCAGRNEPIIRDLPRKAISRPGGVALRALSKRDDVFQQELWNLAKLCPVVKAMWPFLQGHSAGQFGVVMVMERHSNAKSFTWPGRAVRLVETARGVCGTRGFVRDGYHTKFHGWVGRDGLRGPGAVAPPPWVHAWRTRGALLYAASLERTVGVLNSKLTEWETEFGRHRHVIDPSAGPVEAWVRSIGATPSLAWNLLQAEDIGKDAIEDDTLFPWFAGDPPPTLQHSVELVAAIASKHGVRLEAAATLASRVAQLEAILREVQRRHKERPSLPRVDLLMEDSRIRTKREVQLPPIVERAILRPPDALPRAPEVPGRAALEAAFSPMRAPQSKLPPVQHKFRYPPDSLRGQLERTRLGHLPLG
jgi:hypothetical protein